jgi:hypothetical protein
LWIGDGGLGIEGRLVIGEGGFIADWRSIEDCLIDDLDQFSEDFAPAHV